LGVIVSALALFTVVFLANSPSAFGQGATGAINGTVSDASGAVIPGVKVTLQNTATGAEREAVTNATGIYVFVEVIPGNYTMQVSAQGFATVKEEAFTLSVNQTATYNFSLTIGPTVQEVTVAAAAAHVESTTAELGTAVASTEVNELPLNGRNFTQLLTLTPGVSPISTAQNASGGSLWGGNTIGSFAYPSVNGQNNRSDFYTLDGYNNQMSMLAMVGTTPIIDDVQEFKVQSHNDSSSYGFALGGIVNVATKSGTNEYHGDGWEFVRNNVFDARNFFIANTIPYKQNQFGGVIGGPLLPGHFRSGAPKTWFFVGYEGFRSVRASSSLLDVPTAAEIGMGGAGNADLSSLTSQIYNPWSTRPDPAKPGSYLRDPFMCDTSRNPLPAPGGIQAAGTPCNIIPASLVIPSMTAYEGIDLPAPVNTGVPGYNVIDVTPNRYREDTTSLRLDHQFSERTNLWFRYTGFTQPDSVSDGYPNTATLLFEHGYQGAVNLTHTFGGGDKVLAVGFARNSQQDNEITKLDIAPNLALQEGWNPYFASGFGAVDAATPGPMDPSLGITGYNTRPSYHHQISTMSDIYEWKGDFTWVRGHHTMSAGADFNTNNFYEPIVYNNENFAIAQTSNLESPAGTGSALASMVLGLPDNNAYRNTIETEQYGWVDGFYAQDTWKATPKLTVNIGLRYEFNKWPVYGTVAAKDQYVGDLDLNNGTYILARVPPACNPSAGVGAPCIPGGTLPANVVVTPLSNHAIYHTDYDNLGPRLGFAYQLRPTTVIRAAAVKFFDNWGGQLSSSQNYTGTWPSLSLNQNSDQNYPTTANPLPTTIWNNPLNAGGSGTVQLPAATPFEQVAWFMSPWEQEAYSEQWNFGIQQAIGTSTLLEVDYVGSHSSRLDLGTFANQARTPGPGDPSLRRPYPYITPTFYDRSNGRSDYDALQIRMRRTTSKGLSYIISYTWSKDINLGCDGWFAAEGCSTTQDYNLNVDRSVAGYDIPQMLVASWTYQLPFGNAKSLASSNKALNAVIGGWSLNGIYTLRSGEPLGLGVSGDIANIGQSGERPDQVGPKYLSARTPSEYFDTSSFVVPAEYTYGTLGRNALRDTWSPNFDMSIFRDFKLPFSEAARLQLRGEFFNTWNNVVLGGCADTTVQDPNFGKASCTRNTEREVQFALKLFF